MSGNNEETPSIDTIIDLIEAGNYVKHLAWGHGLSGVKVHWLGGPGGQSPNHSTHLTGVATEKFDPRLTSLSVLIKRKIYKDRKTFLSKCPVFIIKSASYGSCRLRRRGSRRGDSTYGVPK